MNGGAPNDNCNALAPIILAFSNLVNLGGPIVILPFSQGISTGSCSSIFSTTSLSSISLILLSRLTCSLSVNGSVGLLVHFFQLIFDKYLMLCLILNLHLVLLLLFQFQV